MLRLMKQVLLFDVDDTLYPQGGGPFALVAERIKSYLVRRLDMDPETAYELRLSYVARYGSTLGGLIEHHGVDPQEFLDDVHDIPVEEQLVYDPRLRELIASLDYERVIFSNGSRSYVERILKKLEIDDLFSRIFTIESVGFIPKPQPEPFRMVLDALGRDASDCIMIDDRADIIAGAVRLGMQGILVGEGEPVDGALHIPDIFSLPAVLT